MNSNRRIVIASLIGSTTEWYDFFLYGTAAALVFSHLYFPSENPTASLLLSYGSFAVSFFVRPLGGALFAHIGDRIGRKKALIVTLTLMGAGTVAIGLLPTYQSIGIWAPILLVLFRMAQGMGLGGEWGGAMLLMVENAPADRKALFGSVPQIGVTLGLLLSTLSLGALSKLPDEQFLSWGWRIPFVGSAFLILLGLWMRSGIDETREFAAARDAGKLHRQPLLATLQTHGREVLVALCAKLADATPFYIATVFIISYATGVLGYHRDTTLTAISLGAVVGTATIPLAGYLADRFGVRRIFITGCLLVVLATCPYFWLLEMRSLFGLYAATLLIVGLAWPISMAILGTLTAQLFSTEVRYSGITLGYQAGAALAGGTAPLLATWILSVDDNRWRWIAFYVISTSLISALAVWWGGRARAHDSAAH